jgi:hypothetical protein
VLDQGESAHAAQFPVIGKTIVDLGNGEILAPNRRGTQHSRRRNTRFAQQPIVKFPFVTGGPRWLGATACRIEAARRRAARLLTMRKDEPILRRHDHC